ncbi:MAG: PEP-CTERM sorting domain-containing protein [Gammaproteobacteria bacterium]
MHNLLFSRNKIRLVTIATLLFASFSASAVVTYQSISSDKFVSQFPGVGNDIYWQGGTNDVDLQTCCAGTLGLNTIGSSVFGANFDIFGNVNTVFQQTEQTFANKISFGANEYSSVSSESEFLGFQDGLFPELQTLTPGTTSFVNVNKNNTASFSLFTQTARFTAESNSIAGYYLNAGQDPDSIFSDTSLFSGLDPFFTGTGAVNISQQGVIDQFNYLIDDIVDPNWQSLAIYYWKSDSMGIDGVTPNSTSFTSGSFVSFDSGAVAVPEPSTYMLLGLGMMALVGFSRKGTKSRIL